MLKQFKSGAKELIIKLKNAEYDYEEARLYYMGEIIRGGWIPHTGLALHWFEKWWKKL